MSPVYLRPLRIDDALISYQWRNNPKIWRFTGNKPDRLITPEIETEWLAAVLKRTDEVRFAICQTSDDKYIGNIFFTDVTSNSAQMHVFIGEVEYWGGGRVYAASRQIMDHAFEVMNLECIYNFVNKGNQGALITARRLGFKMVEELDNGLIKHIFTKEMFAERVHYQYVHKSEAKLLDQ